MERVEKLIQLAKKGDANVQAQLGRAYLEGTVGEVDINRALYWIEQSIKSGCAYGYHVMGNYYEYFAPNNDKDIYKAIRYYKIAAEKGWENAMLNLGRIYRDAEPADYENAQLYYEMAYNKGDSEGEASYNLGWICCWGDSLFCDVKQGIKYLSESVSKGNEQALVLLGQLYGNEKLDIHNNEIAFRYFLQAAEKNVAEAQFQVGKWYEIGRGIATDYKKANYWYHRAVENGDSEAMIDLSLNYAMGQGVTVDGELAVQYARMAVEKGNSGGYRMLYTIYTLGAGDILPDQSGAVKYMKEGAIAGDVECQYWFARYLEKNEPEEAFVWYQKAAEQGNEDAMGKTALCYYAGTGVEKDVQKAFDIWMDLLNIGNVGAHWYLAKYYDEVENDIQKAFLHIREGSINGDMDAKYEMARCYEIGRGVEQSREYAMHLYRELSDSGYKQATKRLRMILINEGHVSDGVDMALKLASEGDADEQFRVAVAYLQGRGVEIDLEKGMYWLRKAVASGCYQAMVYLAMEYLDGENIEQDFREAARILDECTKSKNFTADYKLFNDVLMKAMENFEFASMVSTNLLLYVAKMNHAVAEYFLAYRYKNGIEVPVSMQRYIEWLTKAAVQEHFSGALTDLAVEYVKGELVGKNLQYAIELTEIAADKDDMRAIENLMIMYQQYPRYRNLQKAVKYYTVISQKSKDKKLVAKAEYFLADLYENNYENYSAAFIHRKRSAENGLPEAQYLLGNMYYDGKGTSADLNIARMWWKRASDQGYSVALKKLQATDKKMKRKNGLGIGIKGILGL